MAMGRNEAGRDLGSNSAFILVVEDDERSSRLTRFVLEEEGYSVACVASGEEALDSISDNCPSLILLDIGLPMMDGFTTCQKIRETSQVPIIMVTGEGRDEEKVRGLEMGADDYITKPYSTNELTARVNAVLRRISETRFHSMSARPKPAEHNLAALERSDRDSSPKETQGERNGKHGEEYGEAYKETPRIADGQEGELVGVLSASTAAHDDANEDYEGAVKLVVVTTGAIKNMVDFVDAVRENPQFHLLRMVSNARRDGMDVWLRLREPNPLRTTLLAANGVTKVEPVEIAELDPDTGAETRVLKVLLE